MFFLMRYQIVIATRREINFARQFSSVSLVHRTETNIARQFFEVCSFIIAVQQNFLRGIEIIRQVEVLEEKRICTSAPPSRSYASTHAIECVGVLSPLAVAAG